MTRRRLPPAVLTALLATAVLARAPLRAVDGSPPSSAIQPEHQFGLFPQIFSVTDMAFDLSGNLVIAGTTFSRDFPTTADAADRTCGDDGDAFVIVVSTGGDVRYATCLGGPSLDRGPSLAVSPDGSLWVLTNTCFYESDGINGCTWNGFQATLWRIAPGVQGYVERVPFGNIRDAIHPADVVAGLDGSAWVLGSTSSPWLYVARPWQPTIAGETDMVVGQYVHGETQPRLMTYLGGQRTDIGRSLAVAPDGDVVVVGSTSSTDFPVVRPLQTGLGGQSDVTLTRIDRSGRWLEYSTVLGGPGYEDAPCVDVDRQGNVYLLGSTSDGSTPPFPPVPDIQMGRGLFLVSLDEAGQLRYATLADSAVAFIEGGAVGINPVHLSVRHGGSAVIVGHYYTDELFRSGGFLAVVDRFGLPARHPGLFQRAGGGGEFVMAAVSDGRHVYVVATPFTDPSLPYYVKRLPLSALGADAHGGAADRR